MPVSLGGDCDVSGGWWHWCGSCAVAGSEAAAGRLRVADAVEKRVWRCNKRGTAARDG
jgi:hypothetical protein